MLHIIFVILKIVGILLLVLLGILLFLLLILLFVPIRYDLQIKKKEELWITGKAHWLYPIVSARAEYDGKDLVKVVRILGVPVWRE